MSVILVVEPDPHHAAQLAAMARKHLTSEIVMADSADRAVAAMENRVPDVLLMSSLLSRQDEATLAAWLRDLGPAAAHVQELTIPILAETPMPLPKRRGMLSGLRRDRDDAATTEGCGLDEFASQVSAYVGFAYAHRGIAEPVVERLPPIQIEPASLPPAPNIVAIETAAVGNIGDDEDGWIPIALDGPCEEPARPRRIWALTLIADDRESAVAAATSASIATAGPEMESVAIAEPERESVAVAEQAPVAIAAPPSLAPTPTPKINSRRRRKKPAQDDWGLFDPSQCGFAALVAKLDEITDNNHAEQASADASGNLVAY
jgi:CheY-like chemotaxis protein